MDERAAAKNKQDVEYIGADDIAQRQLALLFYGCSHAGGQFRHGRAAGEDGDGNEFVAYAQRVGNGGGGIHKELAARNQAAQAAQNHDDGQPRLDGFGFAFRLGFRRFLGKGRPYIGHKQGHQDGAVHAAEAVCPKAEEG